jgi:hypothetical protein
VVTRFAKRMPICVFDHLALVSGKSFMALTAIAIKPDPRARRIARSGSGETADFQDSPA